MPTELFDKVAGYLSTDDTALLRRVNHRIKEITDRASQRYITVDLDIDGLHPSLPLRRIREVYPILELTVNTKGVMNRERGDLTHTELADAMLWLDEREEVERELLQRLRGVNVRTCRVLYQGHDGSKIESPFSSCTIIIQLPCETILQVISAGEKNDLERYMITLQESGETVCYTGGLGCNANDMVNVAKSASDVIAQGRRCTWVRRNEGTCPTQEEHEELLLTAWNCDEARQEVKDLLMHRSEITDGVKRERVAETLAKDLLGFCTIGKFSESRPGKLLSAYMRDKRETETLHQVRTREERERGERAERRREEDNHRSEAFWRRLNSPTIYDFLDEEDFSPHPLRRLSGVRPGDVLIAIQSNNNSTLRMQTEAIGAELAWLGRPGEEGVMVRVGSSGELTQLAWQNDLGELVESVRLGEDYEGRRIMRHIDLDGLRDVYLGDQTQWSDVIRNVGRTFYQDSEGAAAGENWEGSSEGGIGGWEMSSEADLGEFGGQLLRLDSN